MYLFPFIRLGNPDAFTVLVSRYKWYLVIARLQLPALSFKGGVVSEGVFNMVPFLNKQTKSVPLLFHFFKCLKFAAFGLAQRMFLMFDNGTDLLVENFKHQTSEKLREVISYICLRN